MTTRYLVLFDADRIKDYVFATGRLKEIRGASEIVRQQTNAAAVRALSTLDDWTPNGEGVIYAGGAAGALLFASEKAAMTFCQNLEQNYRLATGGATLSTVLVPVAGDGAAAELAAQSRAARALARHKASRPSAETIPGGALIRFCASDRLHPASVRGRDPDNPVGLLLSTVAAQKRRASSEHLKQLRRSDFWRAFSAQIRSREGGAATLADWNAATYPGQDLGSIGRQSRPRGYVALVYADGDGIGKLLHEVIATEGFAGYSRLSDALDTAANAATADALARAYGSRAPHEFFDPEEQRLVRALPFEVITIGGDDVILICTADKGLQVAHDLSKSFAQAMDDSNFKVSASVGVVIAHASMPVVQLEHRGRDLLKSAKRTSGDGLGGVDFHVVTTPTLDSIGAVRAREYAYTTDDEQTLFYQRPYRRDRFQTLLGAARELQKLPPSKRADLYHACRGPRLQAMLDTLTIHARLTTTQREQLLNALAAFASLANYPFGAKNADDEVATALIDLLEATEFVSEEAQWAD